jgi:hypothetical protein
MNLQLGIAARSNPQAMTAARLGRPHPVRWREGLGEPDLAVWLQPFDQPPVSATL